MIAAAADILLILPLMLAGFSLAYDFIPVPEDFTGVVIYIIPVLCCGLIAALKHMKNRGRIIMSGVLLAAALAFFLSLPAGERTESLLLYSHVFKLLLVCILCYVAGEIMNRYVKLRMAAALIFTAALPIALVNGYNAGRMCVCMVLMWLLLNLIDLCQIRAEKEGDTQRDKHLVFTAPFICGVFVVIALLPVPEKPYEWKVVKRIGTIVREAVIGLTDSLFKEGESEEVFIGFSGRGDFSGKLKSRNTVALMLHSTSGYDDNLYMAGTVFKDFTGKNWDEDTEAEGYDRRFDAIETMCAVLQVDEDGKLNDALMKVSINADYREIKNKKLFTPSKTYVISEAAEGADYSYRCMYYRLNSRYDKYEEIMKKEDEITEESWQAAREQLGLDKADALSYENYLEYRKLMTERYSADTQVSDRMRAMLEQELSGLENDYDKCVKLASLLRGGVYTNEPGELPAGINDAAGYLDHFMFEKKAGYCSHYATAFVLMARSIGLPARYVQGFKTKVGRKSDTEVRSEAAHAWAEVYLDGTGWIVIEATPGYEVKSGWKVISDQEQDAKVAENENNDSGEQTDKAKEQPDASEEDKKPEIPVGRILIPVLAGTLLALMLWLLDILYKKKRYRAMSEKDKCLYLCRQYMAMFKRLGYVRDESETIGEFRIRALESADPEYLDFLETYERLLYADTEAAEELRISLEGFGKPLHAYIKKKRKEMKEEAQYEDDMQNT